LSKSKNKSHSEVEHFKGIIKEKDKLIRNLQKRIRQLEKTEHMYEDVIFGDKDEVIEEAIKEELCIECGKGRLKVFNVLDRIFVECNVCDYRKKIGGPTG
jgi:hypothetical protein